MSKLYYIENRYPVGNHMLFWAKKSKGYTTDLDKAETYTLHEARQRTYRSIDKFWPKEYIDALATRGVDVQHVDYRISIKAGDNF